MNNTTQSKPQRKDYYNIVIIASNGTIVPETEWKLKVGESTGREFNRQLKLNGMQATKIFKAEEFKAARTEYRNSNKQTASQTRQQMIDSAFEQAEVDTNPRIINALKTLLPLFDDQSDKRIITAFKAVIKAVDSATKQNSDTVH